ncbi:MAG: sugar phosphate isomerase/epimerase [Ktedonobacteraceae bacterium]|nr:sugar phosphate isomerase/epimerase [Ktedonobacteraceae bacterium]
MRIGLSVYGTTFSMGIHPGAGRPAISPQQLMDQALASGLQGVEFPTTLPQNEDVAAVADYARERGLFITLAASGYEPAKLTQAIQLGKQLGVGTVRTMIGGAKIGGDRRLMLGRWQAFLQKVLAGLREATRSAEQAGVNLAVENHQDLASEELQWLCESINSPRFGITLDTGNPLATAEEPLDFARRMARYIKNVHLKDYEIYPSEEGYRLVRCPLGRGVIDFPALLQILAEQCPDVTLSIEIGALEARHIRVLADDYWPEYPPRSAAQLARVLRLVYNNAKWSDDWQTPFERNAPVADIVAYEDEQLATSLAYMRPVFSQAQQR